MKTLPKRPYLQNIVTYYRETHSIPGLGPNYSNWLRQFGFKVPIEGEYLEFPDDFSDKDLTLFVIKWS